MVMVLVGNEDDVGLRKDGIVGHWLDGIGDGVYLNLYAIVLYLHATMFDTCYFYLFTALRGKHVCLLSCGTPCGYEHGRKKSQKILFHCYKDDFGL
jgi:hypothetical protein